MSIPEWCARKSLTEFMHFNCGMETYLQRFKARARATAHGISQAHLAGSTFHRRGQFHPGPILTRAWCRPTHSRRPHSPTQSIIVYVCAMSFVAFVLFNFAPSSPPSGCSCSPTSAQKMGSFSNELQADERERDDELPAAPHQSQTNKVIWIGGWTYVRRPLSVGPALAECPPVQLHQWQHLDQRNDEVNDK